MHQAVKIPNPSGELLDILVEGNPKTKVNVIFIHGFGTDKHETGGLFDDISQVLTTTFRTIRFDLSGYGESEGRQVDANYRKHAQDLNAVLSWARVTFSGSFNILAQSMGCFVTALLSPRCIDKTIMQAIPNGDVKVMKQKMVDYFSKRGLAVNEQGITDIRRSSGEVQQIGPSFWKELNKFDPEKAFKQYAKKTTMLIIHPENDEIIGKDALDLHQNLPNSKYIVISGNHSFTEPNDRLYLIQVIKDFLSA
jgi:hypothetical protein